MRHPLFLLHIVLTALITFAALRVLHLRYEVTSPAMLRLILGAHLLSINLVTFIGYAWDKRASQRGDWRIPERVLQTLALLGGTPAAFLAQRVLRHKNRKRSFQLLFWVIFVMQLCIALWLTLH